MANASWTWGLAAAVAAAGWTPGAAEEPLRVSGETRARYESLNGQFRAGGSGSDQLLLFRSLLKVEADAGPATVVVELQDSRTYLGDAGTPNSSSITNPLDVLQLAVGFDAPGLLGNGSATRVQVGRQTVSIGSKRQIERVSFANVIKSYTGVHAVSTNARGDELHLVGVVPVGRFPSDRASIEDNDLSGDEEQWNRRIWAAHYRRADIAPTLAPGLWGEAFVYGLTEEDASDVPTPNRQYATPGVRLYRKPQPGQWDMDVEAAARFGSRRATSNPADREDLDVAATMLFAAAGYTFDAPWSPRVALEFYHASGDDDPTDGNFDQYERLFGSRRTDLNNTSIHGPLTPANLNAPGARVEVKPSPRTDARLAYSAAYLASDTDAFVIARLRDPSGASGDFIGHTLDGRARFHAVPGRVVADVGASLFVWGDFTETTRAALGAPEEERTLFGYAQVTVTF